MARGARGSSGRKRTRSQGDAEGVAEKVADRAKEVAGQIQERASDALEAAHGQLGNLQAIVADKLEEGADAPLARVRGRVAGGMERTAFWLRENDLGDVTGMVDRQVRAHPLRSALIAFVVGYAMAKSMD
jgi:hypothetical protein